MNISVLKVQAPWKVVHQLCSPKNILMTILRRHPCLLELTLNSTTLVLVFRTNHARFNPFHFSNAPFSYLMEVRLQHRHHLLQIVSYALCVRFQVFERVRVDDRYIVREMHRVAVEEDKKEEKKGWWWGREIYRIVMEEEVEENKGEEEKRMELGRRHIARGVMCCLQCCLLVNKHSWKRMAQHVTNDAGRFNLY